MEQNELTEEEQLLRGVKNKYRISDERFEQGKRFAELLVEGTLTTNKCYMEVFGVDEETAKKKSSKMKHGKWIQELMVFYQFDDSIEYTKESKDAVRVLHSIMMNPNASNRERTDASKALREYIKADQVMQQKTEAQVVNETVNMIGNLVKGIQQLSSQGKMIGKSGNIIDVEMME